MNNYTVIHQAGDGSATWTVTATYGTDPDQVYTILPAQNLNVVVWADGLLIEKDAVDATPANITDYSACTLYLRDTPQLFGVHDEISTGPFGVWVFFWAWLTLKILP